MLTGVENYLETFNRRKSQTETRLQCIVQKLLARSCANNKTLRLLEACEEEHKKHARKEQGGGQSERDLTGLGGGGKHRTPLK